MNNSKNEKDIGEFLDKEVFPKLWSCLSSAFPEFGFQHKGHYWQATDQRATRNLPGSPRPSRIYAYENTPFGFTIQGGDFIPWLRYISGNSFPEGKNFVDAVFALANLAGVCFFREDFSFDEIKQVKDKELKSSILEDFFRYTNQLLKKDPENQAYAYLEKRGFSKEQIENLELGFYPSSKEVKAFLLSKGYLEDDIGYSSYEVENLAKPIGSGLIYDARWSNRLVGVWRDPRGRIINLWARDLTSNSNSKDYEKYLMLKGGNKKFFFNIDKVKGKHLILVEGFLDVLRLQSYAIPDVVGLGGAALTTQQLTNLDFSSIKSLTLNFDYDGDKICRHGIYRSDCFSLSCNSTLQAIEILKNTPVQVFVVDPVLMVLNNNFRQKSDPDSFACRLGIEKYKSLLDNKIHCYRYKAQSLLANYKPDSYETDANKIAILEKAIEFEISITTSQGQSELSIFFWPQIFSATKTDEDVIKSLKDLAREKYLSEEERLNYEHLIYQATKTLKDKGVKELKTLLRQQLKDLESKESKQSKKVVQALLPISQQLDTHSQMLLRWKGKDFIGLPQRSLPKLDKATLGLRGLMLLAAAPNVGKTALAVQFGVDIVENNPDACFIFLSLEMSRWDIISRIKCRLARLDWTKLVFGSQAAKGRDKQAFYTSTEWQRLLEAEKKLAAFGERIYILDEQNFPTPSIEDVLTQIDNIKKITNTSRAFLLIDYLQVWPIPPTQHLIRTELEADKWRIGIMKTLRDTNPDDAILVISEARKPSSNEKAGWGGELSDIMGSARGGYTPDMVFLLRSFSNDEVANFYGLCSKPSEEQITKLKDRLRQQGLTHNKLIIAKGRDGVLRDTIDLAFWYRESYFSEDLEYA